MQGEAAVAAAQAIAAGVATGLVSTATANGVGADAAAVGVGIAVVGTATIVASWDTWRHGAFAAQIEDGMLYGRGAQDMKGGIAAFAAACLAFVAERGNAFDGSIGLLITGDEEGPAVNGTSKLLDWAQARGEHFDACIVGEPTSRSRVGDTLKVGRRGSLNGRLIVTGRQGHVAYPEKADNPIPTLLRILAAFLEPLDEATPSFDPSNLEVTSVDVGNAATNVVPVAATAAFNIRFNDRWTADTLAAEVGRRMERAAAGKDARLEWLPSNAPAFRTTESPFTELLASAIEAETGRRPECSTSGGTSDARFIQRFCPVVELGLVGDTMHMVDERVPVADLEMLTAIYRRVLETFFA